MFIYVFGNEDVQKDNIALKVSQALRGVIGGVRFVCVKPNEDLPFSEGENVVIMDAVYGLTSVALLSLDDPDSLTLPPRTSTHDFDLGFQLKYLKKLGRIGKVKLIGLPMKGSVDYSRVQLILRKLVAQDMQGS